jgi:hypothetical protein
VHDFQLLKPLDARLSKFRAQLKMKLDERKKATDFDATQKLLAKYEKVAQKVQLLCCAQLIRSSPYL